MQQALFGRPNRLSLSRIAGLVLATFASFALLIALLGLFLPFYQITLNELNPPLHKLVYTYNAFGIALSPAAPLTTLYTLNYDPLVLIYGAGLAVAIIVLLGLNFRRFSAKQLALQGWLCLGLGAATYLICGEMFETLTLRNQQGLLDYWGWEAFGLSLTYYSLFAAGLLGLAASATLARSHHR